MVSQPQMVCTYYVQQAIATEHTKWNVGLQNKTYTDLIIYLIVFIGTIAAKS